MVEMQMSDVTLILLLDCYKIHTLYTKPNFHSVAPPKHLYLVSSQTP